MRQNLLTFRLVTNRSDFSNSKNLQTWFIDQLKKVLCWYQIRNHKTIFVFAISLQFEMQYHISQKNLIKETIYEYVSHSVLLLERKLSVNSQFSESV